MGLALQAGGSSWEEGPSGITRYVLLLVAASWLSALVLQRNQLIQTAGTQRFYADKLIQTSGRTTFRER